MVARPFAVSRARLVIRRRPDFPGKVIDAGDADAHTPAKHQETRKASLGFRAATERLNTARHGAEASPDVGNDAVEIASGRDSSKMRRCSPRPTSLLEFLMP